LWCHALALLVVGGCGPVTADEAMTSGDEIAFEDLGTSTEGLAEATCGHSICDPGFALASTCHSCVTSICSVDPFCCTNSWDRICIDEVTTICNRGPVPLTGSSVVSTIKVEIQTGGDDIRGGSQAYGSFQLAGGSTLPRTSLNNGANFPNNSLRVAKISFFPSRRLDSLAGFTLEWDGAPRNIFDTYDNWNADQFRFFFEPFGRCPTFLGAPFHPGRMTGSRTIASTPVSFP